MNQAQVQVEVHGFNFSLRRFVSFGTENIDSTVTDTKPVISGSAMYGRNVWQTEFHQTSETIFIF